MKTLAGTWQLVRLFVRRDRVAFGIWILAVGLLPLGQAAAFDALYPTTGAREAFAETVVNNPVTTGMLGEIFAPTLGGLVAWRVGVMSWLFVAVPSLIFVIRHTRSEEESGRQELLGATVVGRNAPLTAALIVTLAADLLIAAVVAVGLTVYGLPAAGSLALGLSFAASGGIFAAVGAVAAQMTERSGAARSISLVVFAVFFMLRIAGDTGGRDSGLSWLSWASPLGWTRLTRPFADERWWVFLLVGVFFVVVAGAAYILSARRDFAAGLIPDRPGPATASPALRSPFALAWRLQRGFLIGCVIGAAVIGALLGFVGQTAASLLDTPALDARLSGIGANDIGDAFLVWIVYALTSIVCACTIVAVLRLRSEETLGLAEPLLSGPVGRIRWAASHVVFAFAGAAAILAALGSSSGLTYGLATGDVGGTLPEVFGRTMVTLPAVWVVTGIALAAYGLIPRVAAYMSWGILAVFLIIELSWEMQVVSDTVFDISPFAYVHPTAGDPNAVTFIGLLVVAAIFTVAGMFGLRRRDFA